MNRRLEKFTDTLWFNKLLNLDIAYIDYVNYWLRTQLPLHGSHFVDWFRGQHMRLLASYHGVCDNAEVIARGQTHLDQSNPTQLLSKRWTSQRILYDNYTKEAFKRLLSGAKERADAAPQVGRAYERTRLRSWLSVVNDEAGAWFSAGASPNVKCWICVCYL